jgi:3-isopropylmalate/(R)-2-methylmalate dehydratase large subunit
MKDDGSGWNLLAAITRRRFCEAVGLGAAALTLPGCSGQAASGWLLSREGRAASLTGAQTLYGKVWRSHRVFEEPDRPTVLYVDLHLLQDNTSSPAFHGLRRRGLPVHRPERTIATIDHTISTTNPALPHPDPTTREIIGAMRTNSRGSGIRLFDIDSGKQGITHVIGPELGLTQPGMTIVCADSHTSTHGAFGALAFGIGTTEVERVLATQCLLQSRSKTFEVRIDGSLPRGCTAKDVILALLAKVGISGAVGHVIEYRGSCVRALSMEGRMTLCNMTIEAGARAGLIAPDDTTFEYIAGREFAPRGRAFDEAVTRWRSLASDEGAAFDTSVHLDASTLEPMVTWGTDPGTAVPITARVPDLPARASADDRAGVGRALAYMGLHPGEPLLGRPVDVVFLGSCTNARLSDLRLAGGLLRGRKVKVKRMLVVPGSQQVKRDCEAEGLHRVFIDAGCEWREPGCSMCMAVNGDEVPPGQYCVSTSNRNFEGRQGHGARTFLASPLTAAASALAGALEDPRRWMR